MKLFSQMFIWLKVFGLLALSQQVLSQSGYKYGRQEIGIGANPTASANPLRPLVGGLPTAVGALPTATAFGAPTPTTAFGGFPQDPSRGIPAANIFNPSATASTATALQGSLTPRPQTRPLRPAGGGGGVFNPSSNITPQFPSNLRSGLPPTSGRSNTGDRILDEDYDNDFSAIPGVPGVDYPIYSQVPQTNFDCSQQALPGYYSDVEAQCQVFHICALNKTFSFLCPNGTIFSQEVLVCVWWNQYDCATAPSLYANNAFIYDYGDRTQALANPNFPSNTNQLNLVNSQARQQTIGSLTGAGSVGRTSTATNIYQQGNLRTTNRVLGNVPIQGNTFNPVLNPLSANSGNEVGGNRFAANPIGQNFQTSSQINNPQAQAQAQAFNSVLQRNAAIGSSSDANKPIGINTIQETSGATGNREYLPPRRP